MAEPDFDQIVVRLIGIFVAPVAGSREDRQRLDLDAAKKEALNELRQVWNARGAADIDAIDAELSKMGYEAMHERLAAALRNLDRSAVTSETADRSRTT